MHITCLMVMQPASGSQLESYVQQKRASCQPGALSRSLPGFFESRHCLLAAQPKVMIVLYRACRTQVTRVMKPN